MHRQTVSLAKLALIVVALAQAPAASAADQSRRSAGCEGKGIWKSAIPPVPMKGEFDNHDPIGLANGQRIKADCSLNWTDPDDHKLYCFNSATSLAYFLYWPKTNARRARAFWESTPLTQ